MPKDFKASQIRTSALIASGTEIGKPGLLIYSASDAINFAGGRPAAMLSDVGTDVFLFVSGSKNNKTGVSLFGGDLVVSGTLYTENFVAEVDLTTTGSTSISGSLFVSASATVGGGLIVNNSDDSISESAFTVLGDNQRKFLIHADPSGGGQVLILSGGGSLSEDQTKATDTSFFVSGSIGSRGTSTKGTSVFGGDVFVSGTLFDSLGNAIEPASGGDKVGWFSGSSATHADLGIQPDFISTSGSLAVSGALHVASTINHIGDSNTLISFGDDTVSVTAGGTTQLDVRNSVVDVNSSGGNIDFTAGIQSGVVPNNPIGIKVDASTGQVLILSGGSSASYNEALGPDVSFYVSGGVGTVDGSSKGAALFGGDLYASGNLHVENNLYVENPGSSFRSTISVDSTGDFTLSTDGDSDNADITLDAEGKVVLDSGYYGRVTFMRSGDDYLSIHRGEQTVFNTPRDTVVFELTNDSNDFTFAQYDNKELLRMTDTSQILFLSGGSKNSPNEANATDVNFFVSGSVGSRGTAVRGTALYGGDVAFSGSIYGLKKTSYSDYKELNVVSDRISFGNTNNNNIGNEVFFYVSGSAPTSGNPNPSNALFDGPLVVSGNLNILQNYPAGTGSHLRLSNMTDTLGDGGAARMRLQAGRSSGGSQFTLLKYGPNNSMLAGGPHANVFMAGSGSMVFMVGNPEEPAKVGNQPFVFRDMTGGTFFMLTTGSVATGNELVYFLSGGAGSSPSLVGADTNFVVSGSIGSAGVVGVNRGTALFGGDLVVSGGLSVDGETLHVDQANNRTGIGTKSPTGKMHIKSGDSGQPAPSGFADDLIIEGSESTGISILTPNNSQGRIYFGDNDNEQRGYVLYDHNLDVMKFSVANGNRVIIDQGGLSGSLTNLVDGTSYIKAGSGITVASASNGSITISASGGGGGGSVTTVSGSTSVGSVTSIDFTRLGLLTNLGGGSVALTGTIGPSEDGTYSDGLFSSFNANTEIGHAIDKINEVLFYLAPTPPPDLSKIGTSGEAGATALLSLGSSTGAGSSGYTLVGSSAGLGSAVDVNQSYTVVTSSNNVRMGIFTEYKVLTGTLADGVAQNAYINGVINHSGSAFGNADRGELKLYVNGNLVHYVGLSGSNIGSGDPGSGTGTLVNGNSYGFIELSQTGSAMQSNGQEFGLFKYRTGKYQIHTGGGFQRQGWNYARVVHTVGSSDKTTNFIEWFVDNNGQNPKINDVALKTPILSGSKMISGVQYATGARGEYVARIDNFYDHVYAQNAITFTTTNTDPVASVTVPTLPASTGDQFSRAIHATGSYRLSDSAINAGTMTSGSITFNLSVSHPTKQNMTNTGSIESEFFLVYSASQTTNAVTEDFVYEDFRIASASYDTQADLSSGISTGWNSALHLSSSAQAGHGDGLAFFKGRLKSAINTLSNNGDFTKFTSGYGHDEGSNGHTQPNYSVGGASDGQKTFYRYFTNNTGASVRDFDLVYTGSGTSLGTHASNIDGSTGNVKVYVKIPEKTGWMDTGTHFTYGPEGPKVLNYDGAHMVPMGQTQNASIGNSENPVTHHVTFGTGTIDNGQSVILKFVADAAWTGHLSGMNVVFPAVVDGAVSMAPNLDELDITTPGTFYNAKLSFGAGKSSGGPANYFNVTGSAAAGAGPWGVGNNVDYNGVYTSDTSAGSNKRYGVISSNGTSQLIKGNLNGDVNASGNSYSADSFGNGQQGILSLYVNQSGSGVSPVHSVDLATFAGEGMPGSGTGVSVNANNSGFISASMAIAGADADGLFDYRKVYRTAFFQVGPGDQNQKGWNWAQVIHSGVPGQPDHVTTFVEWVNDDDGDAVAITETHSGSFGCDENNFWYQSGVKYFSPVSGQTTGTLEFRVADAYTNVYSNSGTALQFPSANLSNFTVQGIFVTGSSITDKGDTSLSSNGTSMPDLTSGGDITADIHLTGTVTYTGGNSLPGDGAPLNSFTKVSPVARLTVDHPIDTNASSTITVNNFLAFSGSSATSNQNTLERFTAEHYRLASGSFETQSATGSLAWNPQISLVGADDTHNSGMIQYGNDGTNGYLLSPKSSALPAGGNFTKTNTFTTPLNNVSYVGASGERHYFRAFKNNTTSDQAVVTVTIKGDATLVPKTGAGSAALGANKNCYVFAKIPGKTGWLDLAKPSDGTLTDGGGGLSGDRDATIDSSGNSNDLTFGVQFVGGDPASDGSGEHFILAIHADASWTGYVKEVSITW